MDKTITEHDLDATSREFVMRESFDGVEEPDLAVDGLSDSLLGRLLRLLTAGRTRV